MGGLSCPFPSRVLVSCAALIILIPLCYLHGQLFCFDLEIYFGGIDVLYT